MGPEPSLEEAIKLSIKVEELMILITDSERGTYYPEFKDKIKSSSMNVYYPRSPRHVEEIYRQKCWIQFHDCIDNFGNILDAYIRKSKELGPEFHLYLASRRGVKLYAEHRFMNFIWGLESLHRRSYSYETNLGLKEKISRIIKDISLQKDKRWFRNQTKWIGEPNLSDRLLHVIGDLDLPVNSDQLKNFAQKCASRRHDISHFGGDRDSAPYDEFSEEIVKLTIGLDVLYHAVLLLQIGVSAEHIRKLFKNQYRIKKMLESAGITLSEEQAHHREAAYDQKNGGR